MRGGEESGKEIVEGMTERNVRVIEGDNKVNMI